MHESIVCPQTIDTAVVSRQRSGMRWEERLLDLFDDLEQQAAGLALSERDALVAEQSRAEYATLDLAARLHASTGSRLQVDVTGLGTLDATLTRVGDGWCLLDAAGPTWVVPLRAVTAFRGLASGAVAVPARSVVSRLGLGSALREMAEDRADVVLHRLDGQLVRGVLGRVGLDFVEVGNRERVDVVPFTAIAALRGDRAP